MLLEAPPRVTLELTDTSGRAVFELLGSFAGVGVAMRDDVSLDVTLGLEEVPYDIDARRSVAVPVPGREPLALALQAVVLDDPPIAIVSGRVYDPGQTIVDPATGEEVEGLHLDVDEVGPREVVLVVESTGARVRLLLD